MTTLTKIFVVVLTFFSAAFCVLVIQYTAYTANYRELAEENENWAKQEQALRTAGDTQHKTILSHRDKVIANQQAELANQQTQLSKQAAIPSLSRSKATGGANQLVCPDRCI